MEEDKEETKSEIHIEKVLTQKDQIFRIKEEEVEALITMEEERNTEMMRIVINQIEAIKRRVGIIIIIEI
jgi:hypothetical protein